MTPLQHTFIAITIIAPILLCSWSKARQSPALSRNISLSITAILAISYALVFFIKWRDGSLTLDSALPMQLCDWAAFTAFAALIFRNQTGFELTYFWGFAGTFQALLTPAYSIDCSAASIAFLAIHSAIPAGALWLMLEYRMRPRTWGVWRTLAWSQLYLAAALLTNHLTGANYGFLSAKPVHPSLLDRLSDHPVFYIFQIEMLALTIFILLQIPWWLIRPRGIADA